MIEDQSKKKNKYVYSGYNGVIISTDKATHLLKRGCFNCQTGLTIGTPSKWFAEDLVLCVSCHDNDPMIKDVLFKEKNRVYDGQLMRVN